MENFIEQIYNFLYKIAMYVRCRPNQAKNKWTILVCRSVRKGTKVSQEVIKYLGVAHSEEQKKALMRLAQAEIRSATVSSAVKSKNNDYPGALLENMVELARSLDGLHDIFGAMFDKIHLRELFKPYEYERLKDIVICRIAEPDSKLHTAELLTKDFLRPLSEDQIYRLMDILSPKQMEIKQRVFETTKYFIKNQRVEVLFFDVTTLHFESQIADELRNFGMSKAHKIGEVQVVLALATTCEGLPIGYNLFPGNTGEVSTLLISLNEWIQNLNIQDVTVVADRAMMSEANLLAMEEAKFKYTVAAKLRALPKSMKEQILLRKEEIQTTVCRQNMSLQEYKYNGRRIIVSYSESRAKKDRKDREKLLARIHKKLGSKVSEKELITHKGYLKFFKEVSKGEMVLNQEKIIEDARWDGLHGVITNDNNANMVQLLERYRGLWVIEESFRINKHTLAMRPIYHYKRSRIESHILICYIAFAVSRYTQNQVSQFHKPMSVARIREELSSVKSGILEDRITGERYKLPSTASDDALAIYRSLGIKRLNRVSKVPQAKKCSGKQKNYTIDY